MKRTQPQNTLINLKNPCYVSWEIFYEEFNSGHDNFYKISKEIDGTSS